MVQVPVEFGSAQLNVIFTVDLHQDDADSQ